MLYDYDGALLNDLTWEGEVAGNVHYIYDNGFRIGAINVNGSDVVGFLYDRDSLLAVPPV